MIYSAVIYLDEDKPEYMEGVQRIAEVKFYDQDGEEVENVDLSNGFVNKEAPDDNLEDLKKYVAEDLKIDIDQVQFEHE